MLVGTGSVLALGIAGTALDYAASPNYTANATSMPSALPMSGPSRPDSGFWRDDVRWAQVELHDRGFYKGSLDGVLGPATKQAIQQFQTDNGLARTASLDAQTWQALTGNTGIGQGSSMPPGTDHGGAAINAFGKSDSGL
ncbi:MAG TPA: peptidoglycan-binding domain-containing protein [Stellaceae bacterium]|nr:peptidoglycan-binding domain-containing protein [Stellaceae bacterium]